MNNKEELKNKILFYQRRIKEGKIKEDTEIKNAIEFIKDIAATEKIKINKNISSDDFCTIWEEYYRGSSESPVLGVEYGNLKAGTPDIIVFFLSIIILLCSDESLIIQILNLFLTLGIVDIIANHPELLESESIDSILEIIKDVLNGKLR